MGCGRVEIGFPRHNYTYVRVQVQFTGFRCHESERETNKISYNINGEMWVLVKLDRHLTVVNCLN